MKRVAFILFILLSVIVTVKAQEFQIITHGSFRYDTLGCPEIYLNFEVINISSSVQTIFEVRTKNILSPGWVTSLCIGENCFPDDLDSIAADPLQPGDTLESSIHAFPDQSIGSAEVEMQIGTFSNPGNRESLNFLLTNDPAVGIKENRSFSPEIYLLEQNYPNPFNPSTSIKYTIGKSGLVKLAIYDITGKEVLKLVNGYKESGNYFVRLDNVNLSSGVYLYKLESGEFSSVKKLILLK